MNPVLRAIDKTCKKHGDQKALAEKIGISKSYLSEVISGKKAPNDLIANYFGYELVYRKIK